MGKEIERKFILLDTDFLRNLSGVHYMQGYISTDVERVVRVRVCDDKGFITIKGKNNGAVRLEFEYEIPCKEAEEMIQKLCIRPFIDKIRYTYFYKGFVREIDEFFGENSGLYLAEIELEDEDIVFEKPLWIGDEITFDFRYAGSNLINKPYCSW